MLETVPGVILRVDQQTPLGQYYPGYIANPLARAVGNTLVAQQVVANCPFDPRPEAIARINQSTLSSREILAYGPALEGVADNDATSYATPFLTLRTPDGTVDIPLGIFSVEADPALELGPQVASRYIIRERTAAQLLGGDRQQ